MLPEMYIFAGIFGSIADFDPGTGVFNLSALSNQDVFIVKLNSAGSLVWAKHVGGTNSDNVSGISADGNGNVYIAGSFEDTVDFDPGPGTNILVSQGTLAGMPLF